MREELLGYVLGALEPEEEAAVEDYVRSHPEARREVELLKRAVAPLSLDGGPVDHPEGLAHRTARFVALHATMSQADPGSTNRWGLRFHDYLIAASILLVASLLVFPALQRSRAQSQRVGCMAHLKQLGEAFQAYSERFQAHLPYVEPRGPLSYAGIYAPALMEHGYVQDTSTFLCPALGRPAEFHVPTLKELTELSKDRQSQALVAAVRMMGGHYGYRLGYLHQERYHAARHHGDAHFAVLADQPSVVGTVADNSVNHGECGQNVLFGDGHVAWYHTCAPGENENFFLNDRGRIGAGIGPDDAVLASSNTSPLSF